MKQALISSGLAFADFIERHPRRITAVLAGLLLSGGGGAFAVASLAPDAPTAAIRLLTETLPSSPLGAQIEQLEAHSFTLYRSETTRASDSPESLLQRLGVADPQASAFLRRDPRASQALFGRGAGGRLVSAEASDSQNLLSLRTHWVENSDARQFKRLVVEKLGDSFSARIESAPLVVAQHLASGTIRSSLFAATDEAGIPDSVARQLTEIFESTVDFRRGLRKGDRFSIVYETLEADGEPMRAGRVLSAEMVNRGKAQQALWFAESSGDKGAYYDFSGQSLRKAYLVEPLAFTRVTSGFGMRQHPILGGQRGHDGIDYKAPKGTPVRTVGDGTVEFAGVQRGYGNVIYVKHPNGRDTTVYGHLSQIGVHKGERVSQGQKIGEVGATGMATGPHLHFEFRVNDQPINPGTLLASQREALQTVASDARAEFARMAMAMKVQLQAAGGVSAVGVTAAFE